MKNNGATEIKWKTIKADSYCKKTTIIMKLSRVCVTKPFIKSLFPQKKDGIIVVSYIQYLQTVCDLKW